MKVCPSIYFFYQWRSVILFLWRPTDLPLSYGGKNGIMINTDYIRSAVHKCVINASKIPSRISVKLEASFAIQKPSKNLARLSSHHDSVHMLQIWLQNYYWGEL